MEKQTHDDFLCRVSQDNFITIRNEGQISIEAQGVTIELKLSIPYQLNCITFTATITYKIQNLLYLS